ncbi:low molecular weight protein-tyrosine-phosphatase [Scleromatobacter humisilvae]|uniref:protein-tyrosine-phosphatase n=1 Tax=Scleromatobacter humisilvae TaxID=2897159 RepID=A0A9X1YH39_9BURK|nr:low molecular weight protein-tyrosine-phosphatase [Scleromatobacter humisilvae]MCK9686379.1 low molecular weight phosphotyrosine protein phosphatase [Scleromatobacter humisilvae]
METVRILFVCTGNLCRSPMAAAVGRTLVGGAGLRMRMAFDSAGTSALRGRPPIDPRARAVLTRAGYAVGAHGARRATPEDFAANDLVLAMDGGHLDALVDVCAPEHAHKIRRFLDFAPGFEGKDVPDPYFGDVGGFERVLQLCELGVRGLLAAAPGLFSNSGAAAIRDPSAG